MAEISALVRRAQSGDPGAIEEIVGRALAIATPIAVATLGADAGRDAAQDAGVDVLRHLSSLREPASFEAWARRIAVRRALRTAARRRLLGRREAPLEEATGVGLDASDAGDQERVALQASVRAELARLPARQRLALMLRYGHDLTESQVADTLGCRPGTAAALLSRGRARLAASPAIRELRRREEGR